MYAFLHRETYSQFSLCARMFYMCGRHVRQPANARSEKETNDAGSIVLVPFQYWYLLEWFQEGWIANEKSWRTRHGFFCIPFPCSVKPVYTTHRNAKAAIYTKQVSWQTIYWPKDTTFRSPIPFTAGWHFGNVVDVTRKSKMEHYSTLTFIPSKISLVSIDALP